MRLVVQIPALNEAEQLAATLAGIPATLPGVEVLVLLIDDGSTDGTAERAAALGVTEILRLRGHRGLAAAFAAGLERALALGADVVVNIDADGQYDGAEIPALIAPVLAGTADVVVGDRSPGTVPHFSWTRRRLQELGSLAVRLSTGLDLPDATSGFRAMSREAAARLVVVTRYSYTIETLQLAGAIGLAVTSIPVSCRPPTRPSRLFRSIPGYLVRSGATLLRGLAWYRPLLFFGGPAMVLAGVAALAGLGALLRARPDQIDRLILAAVPAAIGLLLGVTALLADGLRANRMLALELLYRERLRRPEGR